MKRLIKLAKKLLLLTSSVVWLVFMVTAICGITSDTDTSGWYQVIIELLGFPLLLYGLFYELPKRIKERKWTPKISIGVVPGRPPLSEIRAMASLPTDTTVFPDQDEIGFWFSLIIRNYGELAARSVKISIEVEDLFFDGESQLILWSDCDRIIPDSRGKDYVYPRPKDSGRQVVVHSGDEEVFRFPIQNRRRVPPSVSALPLSFAFCCRVWADGLGGATKKDLKVEVASWEGSPSS